MNRSGTSLAVALLAVLMAVAGQAQEAPATPSGNREAGEARSRLVVVLAGLRSTAGVVRVSLYAGPEGFPSEHTRALRGMTEEIRGSEVRVVFPDLPPGTYAVSAFHDEDGDGKLKRGLFGIPAEGIAFSRDARNPVGPPKWKDARFDLPPGESTITCRLRY